MRRRDLELGDRCRASRAPAGLSGAAHADDTESNSPSTGERGTKAALSTVLNKGIEEKGLTMEEKWSHDVIVCKRMRMTGSRFPLKVCHTRGEWRAMRSNAQETVNYAQRLQGSGRHD